MNKTVYLTFDDGPSEISSRLDNLLDKYSAKATFFMLEPYMKLHKDIVIQRVKNGHGVGLHGVTHEKDKIYASSNSVLDEMNQTRETLKEITNKDSLLIRTPYGSIPHMTKEYREAVNKAGYKMWDWNVDSRDWEFRDIRYVKSIIKQIEILESYQSKAPLVVLVHEFPKTLEFLEPLLEYFKNNSYEYKVLDESMTPVHFNLR